MKNLIKFLTTGLFGLVLWFVNGCAWAIMAYIHILLPWYNAQAEGMEIVWSILILIGAFITGWAIAPWVLRKWSEK